MTWTAKIFLSLLLIHPAVSKAKLHLEIFLKNQVDQTYAKISDGDGRAFWISSEQSDAKDSLNQLHIQGMQCTDVVKKSTIMVPSLYMAFSPSVVYKKGSPLLSGADYLAKWSVSILTPDLKKIRLSKPMHEFQVIWSVTYSGKGYFVGGVGMNDKPLLKFLGSDLKRERILEIPGGSAGEISRVIKSDKSMFILLRTTRAKEGIRSGDSSLLVYTLDGSLVSAIPLSGADANITSTHDAGIAISYRIQNQIFLEKRNSRKDIEWTTPLHGVRGVASTQGELIAVGEEIAWIGANENRLLIHRVGANGILVKTTTDSTSNLVAPLPAIYSVQAYGKDIHVRGRAGRATSSPAGRVTEFCFVDSPDS